MAMTTSRHYSRKAPHATQNVAGGLGQIGPGGDPLPGRVARTTFGVLGLSAVCAAPLVAIALWLLLTDPVTAGSVADAGEMFPVVQALVVAVGKAIVSILAYV
jgi:hypothetical protein